MIFRMSAGAMERRKRSRLNRSSVVKLNVESKQGTMKVLSGRLLDLSEIGFGSSVNSELPVGALVSASGHFSIRFPDREVKTRARVAWTRADGPLRFRTGLIFLEEIDPAAEPGAAISPGEDHYEALQLSPNADSDTIHRVYRLLAQRYHPDNQESANPELFRAVLKAYRVLSDPEQRSAYDLAWQRERGRRWKVFDQNSGKPGIQCERAKRRAMLEILYVKRAKSPQESGMTIAEIEDLLGVPREHLEFCVWYLRESALAIRTDSGRFSITLKGVDYCEAQTEPEARGWAEKLLPAAGPLPAA